MTHHCARTIASAQTRDIREGHPGRVMSSAEDGVFDETQSHAVSPDGEGFPALIAAGAEHA